MYSFIIVVVLGFGLAVLIGSRRREVNRRKNREGDDEDKMDDSSSYSSDSKDFTLRKAG